MTSRKAILALCMVGFVVDSGLSMIGQNVYLPGGLPGQWSDHERGWLVMIRAATFLTLA